MRSDHWIRDHLSCLQQMLAAIDVTAVEHAAAELVNAFEENRTVFVCGNGGSASTASHMAADLAKNTGGAGRPGLRVMCLNDNMAWLSALANDFGYEHVFVEQLRNLLQPRDVLVAISASGNSPNVVRAAEFVRARGGRTVGLVGFTGGRLRETCDVVVHLQSADYGRVEDGHLILNHILTEALRARTRPGP